MRKEVVVGTFLDINFDHCVAKATSGGFFSAHIPTGNMWTEVEAWSEVGGEFSIRSPP